MDRNDNTEGSMRIELLRAIVRHLDEDATGIACDAVGDVLWNQTDGAEELLEQIFRFSDLRPDELAKGMLGLPSHMDWSTDELVEMFEATENEQELKYLAKMNRQAGELE